MDFLNRLFERLTLPAAEALMVASAVIIHNYQIPANITGPSTLVSLVGNSIVGVKESIVGHFNDPEGFVDALGIALGKLFMVDVTATREEQMNGGVKQNFAPLSSQHRWEKLTNPPTRTAVVAWIIFLLSAQYIHELNEKDRYQNRFLIAGLVIGFNTSVVAWFMDERYLFAFKTFVPFSVAAALVFSRAAHRSLIAKEVAEEKKEQ